MKQINWIFKYYWERGHTIEDLRNEHMNFLILKERQMTYKFKTDP
jgi:hypothetical protein